MDILDTIEFTAPEGAVVETVTPIDTALWFEKYRPKKLDDVIGQEDVVKIAKSNILAGNVTNYIFAGESGIGKTTIAVCMARELFGDNYRIAFTEYNASDDRGINFIREDIKSIASKNAGMGVKLRIILLDESDQLTDDAQNALRRIIEQYSAYARFIFTCNNSSRIIDAIKSRCTMIRFSRMSDENISKIIEYIAFNEGLTIAPEAYQVLIDHAEGDNRKVINLLQNIAVVTKDINASTAQRFAKVPDRVLLKQILTTAFSGEFVKARQTMLDTYINNGFDALDIIKACYKVLPEMVDGIPLMKSMSLLGEIEHRLNAGDNPHIQLNAMLAQLALIQLIPASCTAMRT
jgi:replication factor C small subunit